MRSAGVRRRLSREPDTKGNAMFFGREELIGQLAALCRKRVASLVTCRGRRRIGKSTLVEKFAEREGCRLLKIEGRRPAPGLGNADELAAFAKQLAAQTGAETAPPANWFDAFRRLDGKIDENYELQKQRDYEIY